MPRDFRFRRLGYVALNVTDVARSARFYSDIVGLDCVSATSEVACLRCSDQPHDVVLCRAAIPGLRRIGWQMETIHDLHELKRTLMTDGMTVETASEAECESLRQGETLRVRDPLSGLCHEIFS